MRRSLFEFYTLLICLGSLIGMVATLCWLLFGVLAWLDPELTIGSQSYAEHQTNERFLEHLVFGRGELVENLKKLSDEEITRRRLASYEAIVEGRRRSGKFLAIINGFGLVLSSVLFTLHWRMYRRERALELQAAADPHSKASEK